jgi:hypothetical protein
MNLDEMRTRFRDRSSGLADGLGSDEIDRRLNDEHYFRIPAAVEGPYFERYWLLFRYTTGTPVLNIPREVISTSTTIAYYRPTLQNSNQWPDIHTPLHLFPVTRDHEMFFDEYPDLDDDDAVPAGEPSLGLLFQGSLFLNRWPGGGPSGTTLPGYYIYLPVRSVEQKRYFDTSDPNGVADIAEVIARQGDYEYPRANAVISAAVSEYLAELEEDEAVAREEVNVERWLSVLRGRSNSSKRPRRSRRTF